MKLSSFLRHGLVLLSFAWVACGGLQDSGEGDRSEADGAATAGVQTAAAVPASLPPYEVVAVPDGGTVRGTVRLRPPVPKPEHLTVARDTDVCGLSLVDPSLRVGAAGEVTDAVVSLVGVSRGVAFDASRGNAEMELIHCMAIPHVRLAPGGTMLEIVNSDPILHDLHGFLGATEVFRIPLPLQNFRGRTWLSEVGVVKIRCAAGHPWMSAYVVVQEHPYYTLTDSEGSFVLNRVPPGAHRVRVWHERLGEKEEQVVVEPRGTASLSLELDLPPPGSSGAEP